MAAVAIACCFDRNDASGRPRIVRSALNAFKGTIVSLRPILLDLSVGSFTGVSPHRRFRRVAPLGLSGRAPLHSLSSGEHQLLPSHGSQLVSHLAIRFQARRLVVYPVVVSVMGFHAVPLLFQGEVVCRIELVVPLRKMMSSQHRGELSVLSYSKLLVHLCGESLFERAAVVFRRPPRAVGHEEVFHHLGLVRHIVFWPAQSTQECLQRPYQDHVGHNQPRRFLG